MACGFVSAYSGPMPADGVLVEVIAVRVVFGVWMGMEGCCGRLEGP